MQPSIISHFACERSVSTIELREGANRDLREKLTQAENKVTELDGHIMKEQGKTINRSYYKGTREKTIDRTRKKIREST